MVYIYAGKEARKPVQDIGMKKSIFSPYDSEENVKHSMSFLLQTKKAGVFLANIIRCEKYPSTFKPGSFDISTFGSRIADMKIFCKKKKEKCRVNMVQLTET